MECKTREKKEMISVLGDSICTFPGYNPEGYYVYYTSEIQRICGIRSVSDTWWHQVITERQASLCVNNSYSGSTVAGRGFPSASGDDRLCKLAAGGQKPDTILVYMGVNDFCCSVPLIGNKDDRYCFYPAYSHMLSRLKELYPSAEIICGTLLKTLPGGFKMWDLTENDRGCILSDYNEIIRRVCEEQGVLLADLEKTGVCYESMDGAHPTAKGHKVIAGAWMESLPG